MNSRKWQMDGQGNFSEVWGHTGAAIIVEMPFSSEEETEATGMADQWYYEAADAAGAKPGDVVEFRFRGEAE